LLFTVAVDRERRDAGFVLARVDAGDDRPEVGGDVFRLQAELGGDRVEDVDVEADDRFAIRVEELARRVGRVDTDRDHAVGLDPRGHLGREPGVDGRIRCDGGVVSAAGRAAAAGRCEADAGDGRENGNGPSAELH